MAERRFDLLSFLVGVSALIGAGLALLAHSGAVEVDEVVVAAALLVGLGATGLVRSALRLRAQARR